MYTRIAICRMASSFFFVRPLPSFPFSLSLSCIYYTAVVVFFAGYRAQACETCGWRWENIFFCIYLTVEEVRGWCVCSNCEKCIQFFFRRTRPSMLARVEIQTISTENNESEMQMWRTSYRGLTAFDNKPSSTTKWKTAQFIALVSCRNAIYALVKCLCKRNQWRQCRDTFGHCGVTRALLYPAAAASRTFFSLAYLCRNKWNLFSP